MSGIERKGRIGCRLPATWRIQQVPGWHWTLLNSSCRALIDTRCWVSFVSPEYPTAAPHGQARVTSTALLGFMPVAKFATQGRCSVVWPHGRKGRAFAAAGSGR